ncbi:MAG: hypothetical protein IKQ97_01120 [Eubacterium sp.]|nr:hypothetical protein [Eubacterium sp.]
MEELRSIGGYRFEEGICYGNIQYGPDKLDRTSLVREDAAEYFAIHADRTTDGWEISYRIPLVFIRLFYPDFDFSDILRANAYKCGNKTVQRHYLSWMPVTTEAPNFPGSSPGSPGKAR